MSELIKRSEAQESDTILQVIERASQNADFDVEKMERLFSLYERNKAREAEMAFNAALSALQPRLPVINKEGQIKVGDQVRSRYARFEDINEAVKPLLADEGFAINFRTNMEDGKLAVTGVLSHRLGHHIDTTLVLPMDTSGSKNNVQSIGSTVAYGKRYTMIILLNISTSEDNDGDNIPKITEEQEANLQALIDEIGVNETAFLGFMHVTKLSDIQAAAYQDAVRALEKKRKAS